MFNYILTKINTRRIEKQISQQYMAGQLKISQGYYNKLENGKSEMTLRMVFRIAEILEVHPEELFRRYSK